MTLDNEPVPNYIRPDGSRLWDRTFLEADCYYSGIALVKDEQGTRYIDLWGDTVYSCGQADAQPF